MSGARIIYGAGLLRDSVVREFALLTERAATFEGLSKARTSLSRCLMHAEFEREWCAGEAEQRWSFSYWGKLYWVRVENEEAVQVVRAVETDRCSARGG